MPFSVPAKRSRIAVVLVLSCLGLLFASTAATVLAAGESQRRAAAALSPTSGAQPRLDQANGIMNQLVDSLVEPVFAAPGVGSLALRGMLDILTTPSDITLDIDQYSTVAELLNVGALADHQRSLFVQRWQDHYRAADSALLRHDVTSALRYARENIASARRLSQRPQAHDARPGRELLAQGAILLARTALQAEQPYLHSAAQHLADLAQQLAPFLAVSGSTPLVLGRATDPKQLAAIAGNQSLLPAMRISSLTTVLAGACLEQREVLFGPSDHRLRSLIALGDSVRDIPRSGLVVAMHRESLQRIANPRAYMSATPDTAATPLQTVLHLFVPPSVRARVQLCRALV